MDRRKNKQTAIISSDKVDFFIQAMGTSQSGTWQVELPVRYPRQEGNI